jgi:hypothetical protein
LSRYATQKAMARRIALVVTRRNNKKSISINRAQLHFCSVI